MLGLWAALIQSRSYTSQLDTNLSAFTAQDKLNRNSLKQQRLVLRNVTILSVFNVSLNRKFLENSFAEEENLLLQHSLACYFRYTIIIIFI